MVEYQEYKDIDLPWLKKIPATWSIKRNKQFLHECKEIVGAESSEYTLLSLTLRGIVVRDLSENKGKIPASFDTYKIVEPGDVVFCLFDIDETPRTVGLSKNRGMLTGAYNVFHIDGINAQYLYYYYLALDNVKALRPLYTGLRKTINVSTFLSQAMPVPPRAEQDQIVRFLDWKVSEINKLIGIRRKEISEFNELILKITDTYVTHGTRRPVDYQCTGIDWAPEIPTNWSLSKIRHHFEIKKRIAGSDGYDVFSVTQKGLKVRDIHLYEGQLAADYSGYQFVQEGEFAMNHMDLLTGGVGIADHLGVTSPDYRVFRLFDTEHCYAPYFLKILQLCYRRHAFYRFGHGAANVGRWRLPADAFLNFQIPLPPYEEQVEIVQKIAAVQGRIDAEVESLRKQIEKLEELKSVVVSDVVTGKIDVRGIAVPQYEHIDDIAEDDSEDIKEEIDGEEE